MILGVISDTHGNLELMHKAVALLENRFYATRIIHLGDDYADKETLEREGHPMSGVPGLWCPEYNDPRIPNQVVEEVEGMRVAYAHSDNDLPPLTGDLGLCLVGHTHRYGIVMRQGVPFMNPGHLKSARDRTRFPTFGLARVTGALLYLSVHDLDGEVVLEEQYPR
ncbi:MAG TPA: hypothetical protein ENN29_08670 [Candidatus Hydrogenedentes bacterium]|nr:hypothetical protein [Candidatus Hydrogenedentota bacterium]